MALGEDAAGAAAAVAVSSSGTGEKKSVAGVVGSLAGGLCVSLLTPERYEFETFSTSSKSLSAEDATLLVNAERALATARAAEKAKAAAANKPAAAAAAAPMAAPMVQQQHSIARKPQGKELAWLMRTSYVTAAGGTRGGTGHRGGGGILGEQQQDDADAALDREALLREIDATFAAARALDSRAPAHPTRPGELRAVSVRPVLPHARMAGNHHVLLTLDKDPLADCVPAAAFAKAAKMMNGGTGGNGGNGGGNIDAKPRLTPREEDFLLSRAVTKSYKAARDPERQAAGEEPEKFLGYMVPAEIPEGLFAGEGGEGNNDGEGEDGGDGNNAAAERRDGAGNPSTSSSSLRSRPFSGEYEWVREFMFRIEKGEAAVGAAAGAGAAAAAAAAAAKKRSYLLDLSTSASAAKKRRMKNASGLDAEPVRLVDLDTRLAAFSQKLSTPVNRPSSIRIAARERTAAEAEAARARREAVVGKRSG